MQGLGGNESITLDSPADRAVEAVGGGSDRILVSTTFVLEAGSEVELVTTTNAAGTTAINLTGNAFANTIYGNAGANIVNAQGEMTSWSAWR